MLAWLWGKVFSLRAADEISKSCGTSLYSGKFMLAAKLRGGRKFWACILALIIYVVFKSWSVFMQN